MHQRGRRFVRELWPFAGLVAIQHPRKNVVASPCDPKSRVAIVTGLLGILILVLRLIWQLEQNAHHL
jgi:hypothetical protein